MGIHSGLMNRSQGGLTIANRFAKVILGIYSPSDQPQGLRRGFAFMGVVHAC